MRWKTKECIQLMISLRVHSHPALDNVHEECNAGFRPVETLGGANRWPFRSLVADREEGVATDTCSS